MEEQLFNSMPRYAVYRRGKKGTLKTLTICRWEPASERQHLHPEYARRAYSGPLAWVLFDGRLIPAEAIENFSGYSF